MSVVTCRSCGLVIAAEAVKCPHCQTAFQPGHVRALSRGAVLGLLVGLPLLVLLAVCCFLLLWLR